jgi:four helix bundle protein
METNYKKLIVWQKSVELVKASYDIITNFPKQEQYALSDQIRRSAVSISANIAE